MSAGAAAKGLGPTRPEPTRIEVRVDLDVPGETGRQAQVFAIWLACLVLAVVLGTWVGPHLSVDADGTEYARQALSRARADRAKVGVLAGLVLPSLLTWALSAWRRRGGAHARGIVVDVTEEGELRLWGRGYGSRVALDGAVVSERLVDVYAGRLGAWRQRRLRVHGTRPVRGASAIEIATLAVAGDLGVGLRVEGGEGDCVELRREDFERIRTTILARATPITPAAQ